MKNPNVAGTFYPADPKALESEIRSMLDGAKRPHKQLNVKALVVPHAGYQYSGKTAAVAYNYLANNTYQQVFVLAPSHYVAFSGAAVYRGAGLSTPLGNINISDRVDQLIGSDQFIVSSSQPYQKEHALEVQLPFLQYQLPDFELIPLIIGQIDPVIAGRLADSIAASWTEHSLIVISTDLAHFHDSHLNDQKDEITIELIKQGSAEQLYESDQKGECELCGLAPIMVMMKLAEKMKWRFEFLQHTNSGEITGDRRSVVGYFAAIYF